MNTQFCPSCNKEKDQSDFQPSWQGKSGYKCRECDREYRKERYHINKKNAELLRLVNATQSCSVCEELLPIEAFQKSRQNQPGQPCTKCISKYRKASYDPIKAKTRWLKSLYNLSTEDYDRMFDTQQGLCVICGNPVSVVDHDHKTGFVRSLLCNSCNTGLGSFRDNPELLRSAAVYLESFESKESVIR